MILILVLSLILLVVVVGFIFIKTIKEFGGKASQEQLDRYAKLDYYSDGSFQNLDNVVMQNMGFWEALKMMPKFFSNSPGRKPEKDLPVQWMDSVALTQTPDTSVLVNWFGHSAVLLQMHGKKIMIDPMLGTTPAPHPTLGKNRFRPGLPLEAEQLPELDIVLYSHDHYDHLDYGSVLKIKDKTSRFLVPLGLANHLILWGVPPAKITEFEWGQSMDIDGYTFVCTPAQHFSGRGIGDRGATLWCSWVVQHQGTNIYFSGDSGYGRHFKEIGEKYGPFDFAMLECGQYNEKWKEIHMMPEETALAAQDLGAKVFMPIHWGAFTLAFHEWNEPAKRVAAEAKRLDLNLITPIIGETIDVEGEMELNDWWR
ncbi:MAG: MBL fold metallo-hydrolase [Bacteroidia bacterium]